MISFGVVFSRFIYAVACDSIPLLRLNNALPYVYATFCLSIHPSMDILGCFYLWAVVNNAAVNMGCKYLFKVLLQILLNIYPEVGVLVHIAIPFLVVFFVSSFLCVFYLFGRTRS